MFQEAILWENILIYDFYEDKVISKCPNKI